MIKVENISVSGFEHSIRGMRNPMNSWELSDSGLCFNGEGMKGCKKNCPREMYYEGDCKNPVYCVGDADLVLMQKLCKAGTEHRKYLRQIFVSMDITAPLYWWKEFDTYKVGVTANSCSTMHTIHAKEFTLDDFSVEHLNADVINTPFVDIVNCLNFFRELYIQHHDKDDWWQMIQFLPTSYNQRRTVTMNYENVFTILRQRRGHKLDEWNDFCDILSGLPYVKEIGELE